MTCTFEVILARIWRTHVEGYGHPGGQFWIATEGFWFTSLALWLVTFELWLNVCSPLKIYQMYPVPLKSTMCILSPYSLPSISCPLKIYQMCPVLLKSIKCILSPTNLPSISCSLKILLCVSCPLEKSTKCIRSRLKGRPSASCPLKIYQMYPVTLKSTKCIMSP